MSNTQKGGHGGKRTGAGRKPVSQEMKTRELAQKAIIEKFGSLDGGFKNLLESNDPALKKFVFEHAMGKPTDKVDMTTRVEETRIVDVDADGNELDEFNEGDEDYNRDDYDSYDENGKFIQDDETEDE